MSTSSCMIFSDDKKDSHRKANHIKCQASDMLSLCPVLAMFVQTVLLKIAAGLEICKPACDAFAVMADIVELLWFSARYGLTPAQLDTAAEKFLQFPAMHLGLNG